MRLPQTKGSLSVVFHFGLDQGFRFRMPSALRVPNPIEQKAVPALAVVQPVGNPGHRSGARTRHFTDSPVRESGSDQLGDLPPLGHRLQLVEGAEITKEKSCLNGPPEKCDGVKKVPETRVLS